MCVRLSIEGLFHARTKAEKQWNEDVEEEKRGRQFVVIEILKTRNCGFSRRETADEDVKTKRSRGLIPPCRKVRCCDFGYFNFVTSLHSAFVDSLWAKIVVLGP